MSQDITFVLQNYFDKKMCGYPAEAINSTVKMTAEKILPEYYPLIEAFAKGKTTDVSHGEFSLFGIMKGTGCDYITALVLLSEYEKNPAVGKRAILFRR